MFLPVLGFLGISLLGWLVIGGAATAATTIYSAEVQKKEAEKAREAVTAAESRRQKLAELEAGEYVALTEKQMKIQAMQSQTKTLVELIDRQDQAAAPQIYTLPAAQKTNPLDRINAAIDDFIKGRG